MVRMRGKPNQIFGAGETKFFPDNPPDTEHPLPMPAVSPEPLVFEPIPMERVWGGRRLEVLFKKSLPQGIPIGEIWEIVDRPEAQSVVRCKTHRGKTLNQLWTGHRAEIFGEDYVSHSAPRFPILIKLLDARRRLSLQVHPPQRIAAALRGEPKTEVWYFVRCAPNAVIFAGLREGQDRSTFEKLLREGRAEEAIHAIRVQSGDSILIPSGRLHAIGEGNVIVEVQQNSDTTYRVFDWNRAGLDGKPRKLHIEESLASIDFQDIEPPIAHVEQGVIADTEFFQVERISVRSALQAQPPARFAVIAVIEGSVGIQNQIFAPGSFFLLPAADSPFLLDPVSGEAVILRITLPVDQSQTDARPAC